MFCYKDKAYCMLIKDFVKRLGGKERLLYHICEQGTLTEYKVMGYQALLKLFSDKEVVQWRMDSSWDVYIMYKDGNINE